MIGQLRGIVLSKQPAGLLLDVQGVGYEVDVPLGTFSQLPATGQEVTLHIHFVVREDAHHLYGFYTLAERELFRSLLKVNGVGAKLALGILSRMPPDEFVRCVTRNDTDSLVSLPGIGKKTASRLMIEMRDRLTGWVGADTSLPIGSSDRAHQQAETAAALVALGYRSAEAARTAARVDDGMSSPEDMIRRALQEGVN